LARMTKPERTAALEGLMPKTAAAETLAPGAGSPTAH